MLFAQLETVTITALLEELRKASVTSDQQVIYLFVIVITMAGIGGFFILRYVLTHAREIHTEANRTLLDISAKHEARCEALTTTFSKECAELRQVNLQAMCDARDMVHAARDIAGVAVSHKEFSDMLRKKEEEQRAKRG